MPSLKGPLVSIVVVLIATSGIYQGATDATQGIEREFTGRRSGLRKLLYEAGGSLGESGTLLLGGVLLLAAIAWLVVTLKQRSAIKAGEAGVSA